MAATAPTTDRAKLEEVALKAAEVVRACHEKPGKPYSASGDVRLFSDSVAGCAMTRFQGVGPVPLTRRDVIDRVFVAGERRAEWNLSWEATDVLDEWTSADGSKRFRLFHEKLHGALGGMIGARDFVEVSVSFHDETASWVAYASVEDPRFPPNANPKYVRGTMMPSGSVAVAATAGADDTPRATVFSVVHTIVAGSIPNWLAAKGVASELTYFFGNVTKAFSH